MKAPAIRRAVCIFYTVIQHRKESSSFMTLLSATIATSNNGCSLVNRWTVRPHQPQKSEVAFLHNRAVVCMCFTSPLERKLQFSRLYHKYLMWFVVLAGSVYCSHFRPLLGRRVSEAKDDLWHPACPTIGTPGHSTISSPPVAVSGETVIVQQCLIPRPSSEDYSLVCIYQCKVHQMKTLISSIMRSNNTRFKCATFGKEAPYLT